MSKKTAGLVLLEYPSQFHTKSLRAVGNAGGFSGTQLWRFRTPAGEFCLRRWPAATSHSKVLTTHLVLQHVHTHGFTHIPLPVRNLQGQTLTVFDDFLWELTPWLSGEPLLATAPTAARLSSAARALADFHIAASSYQPMASDHSPGLKERREQLLAWRSHDVDLARQRFAERYWPDFAPRAQQAFRLFLRGADDVERELRQALTVKVPLQFCIRDVRAEHFLFTADDFRGIIDFGAMRIESVAGDVARLVGTAAGLPDAWSQAIKAYEGRRKLSDEERRLIPTFHRSAIVLATMNWIRWVVLEGREFEDWDAVLARMDALLQQWQDEQIGGNVK